jgi:uncharacterized tellurite resistance protein B-like protein
MLVSWLTTYKYKTIDMDTLKHIDNHNRQQVNAHLSHLIQIALADGKMDSSEKEMLQNIGISLGITEYEIIELIESVKKLAFIPPYELSKKFELMYELMKMLVLDGSVDKRELRLASVFALKYGFAENEIPQLVARLLGGIKQNKSVDELFESYKINRRKDKQ